MSSVQQLANDPLSSSWASGFRSSLRTYARTHLPEPMVPTHFVVLRELPKLPNGKVNRTSLPALAGDEGVDTAFVAPRTAVERQLARIWQDLLGLIHIGVETSFFDLGGDSLTVLQMAGRVSEAYRVHLDLRRLLENPTVAYLAQMVSSSADPRVTGADNPRSISAQEMLAEAVLPSDIVPEPGAAAPAAAPYHNVLLTGGTGYTGAFLLRELLDRSEAEVHVLARATDAGQASERVRQTLAYYGLWRDGDERRIVGIAGDTGRPYLGLSRDTYRELSSRVEMIIHNAAESSWTLPYAKVKPVNVLGTLEVLRLACKRRVKPVHYICSIAIYPGHPGVEHFAEAELSEPEHLAGGYRQSKWVADKLVNLARHRGVPTYVYRLGAITGAQDTGACATDTFINHMIKGWIQLGAAMDYDLMLELVPVDYCAAAVAHIALSATAKPAIFNLPGARPVSQNEVGDLLVACGYPLRRLPYRDWYRELIAALERGEASELAPYLPLFGEEQPAPEIGCPGSKPVFDTVNLKAALKGAGIECPPVDRDLFDRYLRYFVSIGYLPAPPGHSARRNDLSPGQHSACLAV